MIDSQAGLEKASLAYHTLDKRDDQILVRMKAIQDTKPKKPDSFNQYEDYLAYREELKKAWEPDDEEFYALQDDRRDLGFKLRDLFTELQDALINAGSWFKISIGKIRFIEGEIEIEEEQCT